MDKKDRNTKVYGVRPPKRIENEIVCVYGCCPPDPEDIKNTEIEKITSELPDNLKDDFKSELENFTDEQISLIQYLIDSTKKARKILYIKDKIKNIDKFTNLNMYFVHTELSNASDTIIDFIFEIIRTYEEDKAEINEISEIPEDFDEKLTKGKIIRIAEQAIRTNFQDYINELMEVFSDITKSLNAKTTYYLYEILRKKI